MTELRICWFYQWILSTADKNSTLIRNLKDGKITKKLLRLLGYLKPHTLAQLTYTRVNIKFTVKGIKKKGCSCNIAQITIYIGTID